MRPFCLTHICEMKPTKTGRQVLFRHGGEPVELRAGDEFTCPDGGEVVVAAWAPDPIWEAFDGPFPGGHAGAVVVDA